MSCLYLLRNDTCRINPKEFCHFLGDPLFMCNCPTYLENPLLLSEKDFERLADMKENLKENMK